MNEENLLAIVYRCCHNKLLVENNFADMIELQ